MYKMGERCTYKCREFIGAYRMGGVVYTNAESVFKSVYEGGVVYINLGSV